MKGLIPVSAKKDTKEMVSNAKVGKNCLITYQTNP